MKKNKLIDEGVEQTHSSEKTDKRFGCDNIKDYHRQRLCRIKAKVVILKQRYLACETRRCKRTILLQLRTWRGKYKNELYKKPELK